MFLFINKCNILHKLRLFTQRCLKILACHKLADTVAYNPSSLYLSHSVHVRVSLHVHVLMLIKCR